MVKLHLKRKHLFFAVFRCLSWCLFTSVYSGIFTGVFSLEWRIFTGFSKKRPGQNTDAFLKTRNDPAANAWEEGDEVVLVTCRIPSIDLGAIAVYDEVKVKKFVNDL